jgi:methylated-DNA-[protein]-cysteine S-methyltransferase
MIMDQQTVETQFGPLVISASDDAVVSLRWGRAMQEVHSNLLDMAAAQLREYDAGRREVFDLPLQVQGSEFQIAVCAAMSAIPFGETVIYGDIARDLGAVPQAVGQACGANPIPVIIPCHRVMGAKGLTGFSGGAGVETKVALLRHEKAGGFLI